MAYFMFMAEQGPNQSDERCEYINRIYIAINTHRKDTIRYQSISDNE